MSYDPALEVGLMFLASPLPLRGAFLSGALLCADHLFEGADGDHVEQACLAIGVTGSKRVC